MRGAVSSLSLVSIYRLLIKHRDISKCFPNIYLKWQQNTNRETCYDILPLSKIVRRYLLSASQRRCMSIMFKMCLFALIFVKDVYKDNIPTWILTQISPDLYYIKWCTNATLQTFRKQGIILKGAWFNHRVVYLFIPHKCHRC